MSNQSLTKDKTVLISCAVVDKPVPTNNQIQLNITNKVERDLQEKLNTDSLTVYFTVSSKDNYDKKNPFGNSEFTHIQQFDVILHDDPKVKEESVKSIVTKSISRLGFECVKSKSQWKENYIVG